MAEAFGVGTPRASGQQLKDVRAKGAKAEQDLPGIHLRPQAVFVAHGMGQQVPFQTLDDVARGLCEEIERRGANVEQCRARTVRSGCETLQRLELYVRGKDKDLPPIHLYEAYWAPLTEGAIGLWQVLRFLFSGGWNALRSDARLNRFMFGLPRQFHINRWSLAAIGVTILTVLALVVIGVTIVGVGGAKFTFEERGWVTRELVSQLTLLFERLVGVLAAGALAAVILVVVARWILPKNPRGWRYRLAFAISALTTLPAFVVILALAFSAFFAIPLIFAFAQEPPFPGRVCTWCTGFGASMFRRWGETVGAGARQGREFVDFLLRCSLPEYSAWTFLIGIGVLLVLTMLWLLVRRKQPKRGRGGRLAGLFLAVIAFAGILALCGQGDALALFTWLLLFGVVLFVRAFLIQFAGDVAIYVSPHAVDRFFDLRRRIKDVVWRAARAVYAFRDNNGELVYGDVAVVGHSLGSVVVYDTLNRLINEDVLFEEAPPPPCCDDVPQEFLDVAKRTRLLLTFGSPLDKTAFIFAQHDLHAGSERDTLAASVQPLICAERPFRWVNLWTPFDILGGPLQYYDTPERLEEPQPNKRRVLNRRERRAITPVAGHTEFWQNETLYRVIYGALTRPKPPSSPAPQA